MAIFQYVFWDKWVGFKLLPPIPEEGSFKGAVYNWRLCLGFIEIRKWGKAKV